MIPVGTPIKFRDRNGSVGKITGHHVGRNYARYYYGLDAQGDPITMNSLLLDDDQVVVIPEALYQRYVACRAWSPEQRNIDAEICEEVGL